MIKKVFLVLGQRQSEALADDVTYHFYDKSNKRNPMICVIYINKNENSS